jgi:hypothetical protein
MNVRVLLALTVVSAGCATSGRQPPPPYTPKAAREAAAAEAEADAFKGDPLQLWQAAAREADAQASKRRGRHDPLGAAEALEAFIEAYKPALKLERLDCPADKNPTPDARCRELLEFALDRSARRAKTLRALDKATKASDGRAYLRAFRTHKASPTQQEKAKALDLLIEHDAAFAAFYKARFPARVEVSATGPLPEVAQVYLQKGLLGLGGDMGLPLVLEGGLGVFRVKAEFSEMVKSDSRLLARSKMRAWPASYELSLQGAEGEARVHSAFAQSALGTSPDHAAAQLERHGPSKILEALREELFDLVRRGEI